MSDHFSLTIELEASANKVYEAITAPDGPSHWWTRFVEGGGDVGDVCELRFPEAGFFVAMKTVERAPNRRLVWECVEQVHNGDTGWADLHDWEGTTIVFDIEPRGKEACVLRFEHVGLAPVLECYETCDSAWRYYLGESLKAYVETGEGMPFADDSEDNIRRRAE